MKPSLKSKLFDYQSGLAPLKLQRRRSRQAFIIMIMILSLTQIANAQKCSPIHSCPAGYTCVKFHCVKSVPPPPLPGCRCVRPIPPGCAVYCGFLSDENNGTSSITISSSPAPQLTIIKFQEEDARFVSIKIFDLTGRLIKTITYDKMEQGNHQVEWNEQDEEGNLVDDGIYILQLDTPNKSETKKISVIN